MKKTPGDLEELTFSLPLHPPEKGGNCFSPLIKGGRGDSAGKRTYNSTAPFRKSRPTISCLVFLLFMISCSSSRLPLPSMCVDQSEKQRFINIMQQTYPPEFSATQRLILEAGGKQYDFTGQLNMRRGQSLRAAAFSDMGGTFVDLQAHGDSIKIIKSPPDMPTSPLSDGVAQDICHLFDFRLGVNTFLTDATSEDGLILINELDAEKFEEFELDRQSGRLKRSRLIADGEVIREAQYSDWQAAQGSALILPTQIYLTNYRWRYKLEIQLLKFSPAIR